MNNDDDGSLGSSSDSDAFLKEVARAPATEAPLPEPDLSGQKLGKYEVGSRLGEGGMGVVYEATDTVLMRKVAFKVLARKLGKDEQARSRLLREARSLAAVNHPNIAGIYEVAEAQGHIFIAMERVQGTTLRSVLGAQGKLAPLEAKRVVLEMSRALAHAHQAGVVHRDLKPENVMLTPSGEVKILDFGLAKARAPQEGSGSGDHLTSTVEGHVVGTPSYMSPEQARGQKVDGRSDLFALGAIFYELLAGRRAFAGASVVETLAAVDRDAPAPLRQATPEVSVELERAVLRCLEKSPEARFQSASELVQALESNVSFASSRSGGGRARDAAALALVAAGIAAFIALAPRPNPLASFEAKLACPMLEASGVPEPSGWLGAAVADQACSRVSIARWTQEKYSVLLPGSLLDYSVSPSEQLPADPFCAPEDRALAVANAKKRGAAWLDGKVEFKENAFHVALELKTPEGRVFSRGEAQHRVLMEAVRLAMEPLWGPDGIPLPEKLPPAQALVVDTDKPRVALAVIDFVHATMNQTLVDEAYARLEPFIGELGMIGLQAQVMRARAAGEPQPKFEVTLDRSSPERFAKTATATLEVNNPIDAGAAADELAAMINPKMSRVARRYCAELEARLRIAAQQPEKAQRVVLAAISEFGWTDAWYPLLMSLQGRPGFATAALAFAAWNPMIGDAWNVQGLQAKDPTGKQRTVVTERAVLLSPDALVYSVNLSTVYLFGHRLDDARMLGARLLSSPNQRSHIAGEVVMLSVEAGEARFRAALDRSRRVLSSEEVFGDITFGDEPLVRLGLELARILGESEPFAELVYTRFVKPEPPHLDPGPWGVTVVSVACAFGAPEVARACLERLEALIAAGFFRDITPMQLAEIEGAGHFARGDWANATAAFRKGAVGAMVPHGIIADAFDRSGDPTTASTIDERVLTMRGLFAGGSMALVREARRAVARKDTAKARENAEQLVKAWSDADTSLPSVTEMRELLAKLPQP